MLHHVALIDGHARNGAVVQWIISVFLRCGLDPLVVVGESGLCLGVEE